MVISRCTLELTPPVLYSPGVVRPSHGKREKVLINHCDISGLMRHRREVQVPLVSISWMHFFTKLRPVSLRNAANVRKKTVRESEGHMSGEKAGGRRK